MLDLAALNSGITTLITATTELAAIKDKTAFGFLAEGTSYPKCRVSQIPTGTTDGSYGNTFLDRVHYQFSVFATDLAGADNIRKAICVAFHGSTLTLSAGTSLASKILEGSNQLLVEVQEPNKVVYHALVVIEFRIQN